MNNVDKMLIPKNKTKVKNVNLLYSSILGRVGKKGTTYEDIKMLISKEDFINFVLNNKEYNRVYKLWKDCDFETALAPTIDRIDNDKHYTLDNIQVLSKMKNSSKGSRTIDQIKKTHIKPYLKEKRDDLIHKLKEAGYNNQYIGEMFNLDRSTINRITKPDNDTKYFKKLKKELSDIENKR